MSVEIRIVRSSAERRWFVRFPAELYKNDPLWSPPLWSDEYRTYTPGKNPILEETDYALMLAFDNGKPVGRNLVYVNHAFNVHYRTRIGFFGAFEAIDDQAVAHALLSAAEDWLRNEGVTAIRGPVHPVAELWGLLVDGFDKPGVFMTPWNPPYYDRLIKAAGYEGIKNLVAYEIDARDGFVLPKRYADFYDHFVQRHPEMRVRAFDPKNLEEDAAHIWRLGNLSLVGNWGFLPFTRGTLLEMIRRLGPIADPDAIWFVEHRDRPVAFCIGYPDLNVVLRKINGRLFPFGWLRVLREPKKLRDYRLFGLGVDPRYHGMGLDALMYVHLTRALAPRRIRLEANWVLEDNVKMTNALDRLEMRFVKRYRVYEKPIFAAAPADAIASPGTYEGTSTKSGSW